MVQEERWRRFFQDPASWWDNRRKNWAKYPDFKHATTGEGLWIASCPQSLRHRLGLLSESISNNGCRAMYRSPEEACATGPCPENTQAENFSRASGTFISRLAPPPTVSGLLAAVKTSTATKDLESGMKHHAEAISSGYNTNPYVATALVSMYSKCGRMEAAVEAFSSAASHDVGLWNALILGFVRNGEEQRALDTFSRLQTDFCQPNARTMMAVFMACSGLAIKEERQLVDGKLVRAKSLEKAVELHKLAAVHVQCADSYMQSSLIELYAKCGSMTHARSVFDTMPSSVRNVVVWNSLIWGYLENGESQLALDSYASMTPSCSPNARTFAAAAKACAGLAGREQPKQAPNGRLVRVDSLRKGAAIHSQASKVVCIASDVHLGCTLINMYAKCGTMSEARKVFDGMKALDVVVWNALLLGYVENEDSGEALRLFTRLKSEQGDIIPDATSYTAALMACGKLLALDVGREVHAEIERKKLWRHAQLATSLVDFYSKCGVMEDAEEVFRSLDVGRCGVAGWNALAAGYSQQGDVTSLLQVVQRMQDAQVKPDGITYLLSLTACSNAGLVEEGRRQFDEKLAAGGATLHHYTCMIDLLGRTGCFDEMESVMNAMPFKPDAVLWRTLLAACRKWNKVDLGELAFESLIRLDGGVQHGASYVLMGEIYGNVGMWEEQKSVMERKKVAGAHKQWGRSWWTDHTGSVHNFVVGDTRHVGNTEINAKVEELVRKLADSEGYHEASGEAEELCGHSEKLALAWALLNTPDVKQTIRITKNLRMCDDCHTVTAMVSKLERRQIICRDGSRLHLFKDGKCSCKGYW